MTSFYPERVVRAAATDTISFPHWESIEVGRRDALALIDELKRVPDKLVVPEACLFALRGVEMAPKREVLELTLLPTEELGFDEPVPLLERYARAKALGLKLCPQETAAELALQNGRFLAEGERCLVASEPVIVANQGYVFILVCDKAGWWMDLMTVGEADKLSVSWPFVFVQARA